MPTCQIKLMSQLKLLVWNVRGAKSGEFLNNMFEYIRIHKQSIVVLLETPISGDKADEVCHKLSFQGRFRVEAQGFTGGIWLLRDVVHVQLNLIKSHIQFVTMEVNRRGLQPCLFTTIYASPLRHLREQLWQEIEVFAGSNNVPWMLTGDFNEMKNLNKKDHGSDDMDRRWSRFNNVIENNGLIDTGFFGPKFTWSCGNTWITRKSVRFATLHSNVKPFRFQVSWIEHHSFEEFLQHHWNLICP